MAEVRSGSRSRIASAWRTLTPRRTTHPRARRSVGSRSLRKGRRARLRGRLTPPSGARSRPRRPPPGRDAVSSGAPRAAQGWRSRGSHSRAGPRIAQRLLARADRRAHQHLVEAAPAEPVPVELQRALRLPRHAGSPGLARKGPHQDGLLAAQEQERDVAVVPVDQETVAGRRRPRGRRGRGSTPPRGPGGIRATRGPPRSRARPPRGPPPRAPAALPGRRPRRGAPRARRRAGPCAGGSGSSPRRPTAGP